MITIQRANLDNIILAVITNYTTSFQSDVTKNPVDGKGDISDHIVNQNPSFQIEGWISDYDMMGVQNVQPPTSNNGYASSASISLNGINTSTDNTVGNYDGATQTLDTVRSTLQQMRDSKELFTIVEKDNNNIITNSWDNCVFNSIVFSEDEDTGNSLKVTLSAEQITIVTLVTVKITVKDTTGVKKSGTAKTNTDAQGKDISNKGQRPVTDLGKLDNATGKNLSGIAKDIFGLSN